MLPLCGVLMCSGHTLPPSLLSGGEDTPYGCLCWSEKYLCMPVRGRGLGSRVCPEWFGGGVRAYGVPSLDVQTYELSGAK